MRRTVIALVFLGVVLRLWQFAAEGSLWLDEISLSRNILALSLAQLMTEPLAFDQIAPPGFLAAVKLSTMAFGSSELALWLFPLLTGLAGLFLFATLAQRALSGFAVPLALALFATGVALIRYSAEVKQYGADVTATVAMTLLALNLRERDYSTRWLMLAGASGFLAILFSQAVVLVMTGLGGALALLWLIERDDRTRRALLITVPLWAAASVTGLLVAQRNMTASTRAYMEEFWRGGFLPLPARISTGVPWIWQRLVDVYRDSWTLRYPAADVFAVLAVLGIMTLLRRRRDVALLIVAPLVVTLGAAIAQHYPFRQRLVVFLIPGAMLAAAAGAGWIADIVRRRSTVAAAAVIVATLIPPVAALAAVGMHARVDHYHPLYRYLESHRRPGDAVYVSFLANSSAIFYGPRYGLRPHEYHVGPCDREDVRTFLRDFDRFRGQRVWLLSRTGSALKPRRQALLRYLDRIGVRRDSLTMASAISDPLNLELYDLRDPERLRAASAETFPVPPLPVHAQPGCRDWSGDPRAIVDSSLTLGMTGSG